MSTYPAHPLADLFPPMSDAEYGELLADIREHGQRQEIVLWQGQVLDGRHRLRACEELGIPPRTKVSHVGEADLPALVLGLNLKRRHLNESQRAIVAAKLATLKRGRPATANASMDAFSQSDAAQMLDVSLASVNRAARVLERAAPEIVTEVERGHIAVRAAAELTALPPETQREIVAQGAVAVQRVAKDLREQRRESEPTPAITPVAGKADAQQPEATPAPAPTRPRADDAAERWSMTLYRIWVQVNSLREHGGITRLSTAWGDAGRLRYANQLRDLIALLSKVESELRGRNVA